MPITPHQRRLSDVREAMALMTAADIRIAAQNIEFPAWARREYEAESRRRDAAALREIAKALFAYANAADGHAVLRALLDRVAVPGGEDIRVFANRAAGIASRMDVANPPGWEVAG